MLLQVGLLEYSIFNCTLLIYFIIFYLLICLFIYIFRPIIIFLYLIYISAPDREFDQMLKDVIVDQRISHVEVSLILSLLIHRGCEPYGMKRMLDNI